VLAEDFKTISGKEYKNATVSRVEPDGIVLKRKSGITESISRNYLKTFRNGFIMTPPKVGISPATERQRAHSKM
jgi:hypothetical protein